MKFFTIQVAAVFTSIAVLGSLLPAQQREAQQDASATALYLSPAAPVETESVPEYRLAIAGRETPLLLRVTFPKSAGKYPVIVYSHGAMGSKDNYQPLIEYWAARGYVCIQPTHGDSLSLLSAEERRKIESVRDRLTSRDTMGHWRTRPEEIKQVLDALPALENAIPGLAGKIDRERIGVGGHSFGAHTTQMIGGLSFKLLLRRWSVSDERPKCLLMISPPGPGAGADADSFRGITRPTLVVTGTNDVSPTNNKDYRWRLEVYDRIAAKDKLLLFIEDAHHGFGGIAGPIRFPGSGEADATQVAYIQTASTAFWDAYLKDNAQAAAYLHTDRMTQGTGGKARLTQGERKP